MIRAALPIRVSCAHVVAVFQASLRIAGCANLSHYAAFQAIAYRLPAYSETSDGAGTFALNYDGSTSTADRTELGLRLDRTLPLEDGASLTLSGRTAWAINSGDTSSFTAGFETLPRTAFAIDGAEPDQ